MDVPSTIPLHFPLLLLFPYKREKEKTALFSTFNDNQSNATKNDTKHSFFFFLCEEEKKSLKVSMLSEFYYQRNSEKVFFISKQIAMCYTNNNAMCL